MKRPIPSIIEEPIPGKNHVICAVCREKFEDYLAHIRSNEHKMRVQNAPGIYNSIDEVIDNVFEI